MASSSSVNWLYDVFVSFRGEDVRINFLSHFFKELDRKLITVFKDNKIEKSHSLSPELEKAIRSSRIAVVIFSKNYASSSWCLNELLEIVNCKDKIVIPVFYGLDPSHVRKQIGDFGKIFEETCKKNNTEEVKNQWKKALTNVANMVGFDSANWNNEAKMIEEIATDVLGKLLPTSSKDFENFVGIEDHIAEMSVLLQLESEEVRMVGIWGSSGIGKTTISRALFNQLSRNFQGSIFIDRAFVSETKYIYSGANPDDHNMKLHLQKKFLSEILGIKGIKIDHLGALRERLQHQKVLIIIDDLDDLVVLEVLAGQTQWFGSESRIIVVTNNKQFLRAHRIDHIYEVSLPTIECACEMLCQSAFRKNSPPEGFEELVVKVSILAGNLPLGLNVLGSYLRGRDKEYWMGMLPRLQNGHDKIEKILRFSYDGLDREDQAVFCYIACLFNHMEETTIKSLLEESNLGVDIALENLADKSLIHIRHGHVVMHCLLEEMCKKIVGTHSIDKPGERELLVDSKDICHVLGEGNGTQKVLGISLDTSKIDELHVHENAFKRMPNLRFLVIDSKKFQNEGKLHLHESFDYLPPRLKLFCWPKFPMSHMPSNFCPRNLVKLDMGGNKLEKLWEGVVSLTCLKELDLSESYNLKEIPDLSNATNLEKLDLKLCMSLVELPSSIRNLNKLLELNMGNCKSLTIIPTGFNLESLKNLSFYSCSHLRIFPEFSTNISILDILGTNIEEFPSNLHLENLIELSISKEKSDDGKQWDGVKPLTPFLAMLSPTLTTLELNDIPSLVELPSSFQNFNQLKKLLIYNCSNLETLPTGINLKSLDFVTLSQCSRLRSFPEISTNISRLELKRTGIKEVPWWIENFSNLTRLDMERCRKLKCVSLNISKLKHLDLGSFSGCGALTRVDLSGYSSEVAMEADNIDTIPQEASSSLSDDYFRKPWFDFSDCFKLDIDALLQQQSIIFKYMILPGEEVPSYFTHRTNLFSSSLHIPLRHVPLSQPFFRFRACAVVVDSFDFGLIISLQCKFKGRFGNSFDAGHDLYVSKASLMSIWMDSHIVIIIDCRIPINEDNAPLAQWNYDHVDMEIDVRSDEKCKSFKLKGWGIRLLEESSSPENRLGNPNTLQHVCEADKDNTASDGEECEDSDDNNDIGYETDQSEECGDSDDSDIGSETDQSEECGDSDVGSETDQNEESGDSDDSDIGSETDQSDESGDSGIGNENDRLPHVSEANEENLGHFPLQGLVNETEHSKDSGDSNVDTERNRKRKRLDIDTYEAKRPPILYQYRRRKQG